MGNQCAWVSDSSCRELQSLASTTESREDTHIAVLLLVVVGGE